MKKIESHGCFGGVQEVWEHPSESVGVPMRFSVYRPSAAQDRAVPVLYFLSGLTCTEQNFITKAGAQRYAEKHGVLLVGPDTSPRGEGVPDDDDSGLGIGAGFYLNATQAPWSKHYRMYDYVTQELPALVGAQFNTSGASSIFGHSMGGHGALICALKNPGKYRSVSALAPIVAPSQVAWGQRALAAYLGEDESAWQAWDSVALVRNAKERLPLLVDQGLDDPFLEEGLRPELLEAACAEVGHSLTVRRHAGYDHGYYFIASFVGDHIDHHARALLA